MFFCLLFAEDLHKIRTTLTKIADTLENKTIARSVNDLGLKKPFIKTKQQKKFSRKQWLSVVPQVIWMMQGNHFRDFYVILKCNFVDANERRC